MSRAGIPPELGNLHALKRLYLIRNQLSGEWTVPGLPRRVVVVVVGISFPFPLPLPLPTAPLSLSVFLFCSLLSWYYRAVTR